MHATPPALLVTNLAKDTEVHKVHSEMLWHLILFAGNRTGHFPELNMTPISQRVGF